MANFITLCRIIFSTLILFFPVFSHEFYFLYISAGVSDMLDGFIARRTDTTSELGSKLDTLADIAFTAVCLIKLLPVVDFPRLIYAWAIIIAAIKLLNLILGFAFQKKLLSLHTIANKLSGLLLFLFPITLGVLDIKFSSIVICIIATFAALQEGFLIIVKNKYSNRTE